MNFNVLRSVAATLSVGVCTIASAQYGPAPQGPYGYGAPQQQAQTSQLGVPQTTAVQSYGASNYQQPQYQAQPQQAANNYQAPAKWNSFGVNNGPALFQPASTGNHSDLLPTPEAIPTPAPNYGSQQHSSPAVQQSVPAQYTVQPQYSGQIQNSAPVQHSAPMQHSAPVQHQGPVAQGNVSYGAPVPDAYCESCNQAPVQSQFAQAASQPWEGVSYAAQSCGMPVAAPTRAPLFPWFGSFDLLFFNMETSSQTRNTVSLYSAADPTRPYLPYLNTGQLDPSSQVGYDLSFGRYLGCGQYGLGVSYFNWDPDAEVVNSPIYMPEDSIPDGGGGGAMRASGMPQYNGAQMNYMYDNGGGGGYIGLDTDNSGAYDANDDYVSVYDMIDGRAGQGALNGADGTAGTVDDDLNAAPAGAGTSSYAEAVRVRARRDVDIQGVELNLFSFGLMGAQRASAMGGGFSGLGSMFRGAGYGGVGGYGGGYGSCGPNQCQPCGDPCAQSCGPKFGFGGAAGPLVRPCNGKVQIVTSHGLRWFQFKDSLDFAYDVDGRAGYTMHDIYDNTSTENDLLGYQFGSRLIYCLHNRVNLNVGGKFGIYGNQAEFRHRLGSQDRVAYLGAMPDQAIDFHSKDTVLSTLGELDLGLGIRITNGWTARGGYRLMGVTGVASADDYSRDYSSVASASTLNADSSLLLHGAYIGADFNF
ncbi:hypothetical protein [Neorhodopirellula lusitana]|uniref:hypothetical protein n=1 Tax=Neorhodopirellula lusitana TaxID=445327 RepID=UPI00384B067B